MDAILRNVTYNNPDIKSEINRLVGNSYPLFQRLKMRGTGSPKYLISGASNSFMEKLMLDNNLNYISIEIRPGGIIVFFRSLLETFGWIIPFNTLKIKKNDRDFELRSGMDFMIFENNLKYNSAEKFLDKILGYKDQFNNQKSEKNA
ncbi:MAG: hypothetical protein ACOCZL_00290 [Bacteroidota bacterium]